MNRPPVFPDEPAHGKPMDYAPTDWSISIDELLRAIQFYNSLNYFHCPEEGTEDGFCPGAPLTSVMRYTGAATAAVKATASPAQAMHRARQGTSLERKGAAMWATWVMGTSKG